MSTERIELRPVTALPAAAGIAGPIVFTVVLTVQGLFRAGYSHELPDLRQRDQLRNRR